MTILKNVWAVFAGVVVGSLVNMAIVILGIFIIPLPEGASIWDPESLKAVVQTAGPTFFIPALLAHAIGTLVGAAVAAYFATTRKMAFAIGIGCWFLIGGIAAIAMNGGPLWFKIVDLVGAYIPMGFLGGKLAGGDKPVAQSH